MSIGTHRFLLRVGAVGLLALALTGLGPEAAHAAPVASTTQPFQAQFNGSLADLTANSCVGTFTIPGTQRLVVEHISLNAVVQTTQDALFTLAITNGTNSNFVNHTIDAHRDPGRTLYVASHPLEAFGAAGSQVCVAVQRFGNSSGIINVSYTISGYLVGN